MVWKINRCSLYCVYKVTTTFFEPSLRSSYGTKLQVAAYCKFKDIVLLLLSIRLRLMFEQVSMALLSKAAVMVRNQEIFVLPLKHGADPMSKAGTLA
jgi:hypothetical protein